MYRLITTAVLALSLAPASVHAAQTYGLVIGVDKYAHIPDLDGAVNDARDIADALKGLDAEVVLLLDEAASREAILSNWRMLAARMTPDDTLVVSYAGHGSNEPEHNPGTETDGRDETLLLSGFAPAGAAAGERILDDEIAELIALTPAAQIIFVADSCHSGTVSRNINPVLGYRYFSHGKLVNDPLPPPPPPTVAADGKDDVALFLAAVDDAEKVPEFLIDGKPRGALSYSFASGLRGAADLNADNRLTKGEIEEYVRRKVRSVSQGLQNPQASPLGSGEDVLFAMNGDQIILEKPAKNLFELSFDELPEVTLSHTGKAPEFLPDLYGIRVLSAGTPADLTLDLESQSIRSMVGDTIRKIDIPSDAKNPSSVQDAIDKFRLARALEGIADNRGLEVQFAGGDRSYRDGDVLTVEVAGRTSEHITLFNIASDGTMAYLYPVRDSLNGFDDPWSIEPSDKLNLGLQIAPPYGADHIIALETKSDPALLRRVMSSYDGATDVRTFWNALRGAIRRMPDPPHIALFPFYSTDQ